MFVIIYRICLPPFRHNACLPYCYSMLTLNFIKVVIVSINVVSGYIPKRKTSRCFCDFDGKQVRPLSVTQFSFWSFVMLTCYWRAVMFQRCCFFCVLLHSTFANICCALFCSITTNFIVFVVVIVQHAFRQAYNVGSFFANIT